MRAQSLVDVDYRKWDGRPHYRFAAHRFGDDAHGTWLGVVAGTTFTGPIDGAYPRSFVILVPNGEWWCAAWNISEAMDVYVDVIMPAEWTTTDHVRLVDLDLDVIRLRDGRTRLDDEDEFAEHRVLFAYPDDVVTRAEKTARDLVDAVRERREPFDEAPVAWLGALAQLG